MEGFYGFISFLAITVGVAVFFFVFFYLVENKSFKRIRPLKSQIINSNESAIVKMIFHEEMTLNYDFKQKLKSLNKNKYDSKLISYAYNYVNKILNQELRDLISTTGDYSSSLNSQYMVKYQEKSAEKRKELLDDILESKIKPSSVNIISSDLEEILFNIKVKSQTLESVISKSLYLNAITLTEKYNKSIQKETKVKIIQQLKDIESFLDRDIEIVSENKDKEIVNSLNANDIYLKNLETHWNQE